MARRTSLSLNEWAVLACLVERPRHGYEIARELAPPAEVGAAWRVPRQRVYRALDRLVALDLARPGDVEAGDGGPPRRLHVATAGGHARLRRWLAEPVVHLRDVRSGLMLKLVVARRLGVDARPLVEAQRARFALTLDALAEPPPPGDPVALWRHHSALAVRALLADLATCSGR